MPGSTRAVDSVSARLDYDGARVPYLVGGSLTFHPVRIGKVTLPSLYYQRPGFLMEQRSRVMNDSRGVFLYPEGVASPLKPPYDPRSCMIHFELGSTR